MFFFVEHNRLFFCTGLVSFTKNCCSLLILSININSIIWRFSALRLCDLSPTCWTRMLLQPAPSTTPVVGAAAAAAAAAPAAAAYHRCADAAASVAAYVSLPQIYVKQY